MAAETTQVCTGMRRWTVRGGRGGSIQSSLFILFLGSAAGISRAIIRSCGTGVVACRSPERLLLPKAPSQDFVAFLRRRCCLAGLLQQCASTAIWFWLPQVPPAQHNLAVGARSAGQSRCQSQARLRVAIAHRCRWARPCSYARRNKARSHARRSSQQAPPPGTVGHLQSCERACLRHKEGRQDRSRARE